MMMMMIKDMQVKGYFYTAVVAPTCDTARGTMMMRMIMMMMMTTMHSGEVYFLLEGGLYCQQNHGNDDDDDDDDAIFTKGGYRVHMSVDVNSFSVV